MPMIAFISADTACPRSDVIALWNRVRDPAARPVLAVQCSYVADQSCEQSLAQSFFVRRRDLLIAAAYWSVQHVNSQCFLEGSCSH